VLTTFANQAAIAIENARLYAAATGERDRAKQLYEQTDAALARRLDELTTIEQISRQLTSTLDLQEVMQLVMERVLQATQAARGVIALYEPPRNALKLLIETGYPAELERYRTEPWPDSRGITGRVARTGRSAMVPDVTQDADYAPITATTRSQLSVPIVYEGQVIGVITLESEQPAAFTEEHLRFAELVAGHAAIGINNARLFEKVVDGRDRLQAILNSTQDVVIVFDMEGRVILSNPRVSDLFGREVGDWLRSAHVLDIARMVDGVSETADLDIECLKRTLRQVRDCPDKVIDVAFSYRDGDKRVYVQGMVSPVVGAKGNAIGRVAVLRDVTHQQELVRFREDLTSMVIHNLQGPLAAVISSLETLNELEPDDDAMADELLGIALGSGRKLYSRIESVLWLRRLEDRQWPLERLSLPLSQVVQPVLDEYQSMAVRRRVALTASLAADVQVYVDEDIIGRVFSNLVDNALKYTPPGGQIRVRATREVDEGQPVALCSVADTGVGITKDAQASIFDRFRRFVRPEAGEPKGMGIGLHYCRLAVEAHGGQIWVESEEGKGCTFYLTLPMAGDQRH
jgi:PAS domain S-box-containing protein